MIALDTETTGLLLRHGARPFFISTWDDRGENGPGRLADLPGCSRNWRIPINPATRLPSLTRGELADLLDEVAALIEGQDLVFFNAPFDLTALASVGLYISFEALGSRPFDTLSLREKCRPSMKWTLPSPLVRVRCGACHDVSVLAHVTDNKKPSAPAGLKDAAIYYLELGNMDETDLKESTIAGRRRSRKTANLCVDQLGREEVRGDYWLADPEKLDYYASLDAYRTLALYYFLRSYRTYENEKSGFHLWEHYTRQLDYQRSLLVMESQGIAIRPEQIADKEGSLFYDLSKKGEEIESRLVSLGSLALGESFNPRSPKQLYRLLYEVYDLPVLKLTAKAQKPSTDADTLKSILRLVQAWKCGQDLPLEVSNRDDYQDLDGRTFLSADWRGETQKLEEIEEVLKLLVSYDVEDGFQESNIGFRTYATAKGYLTNYLASAISEEKTLPMTLWRKPVRERWTGEGNLFLFPSFNLVGTTTTRLSSSNPNGQNVSKKPQMSLRRFFGPPKGKVWALIDYSQLELRLFAVASQDDSLLSSFQRGYDFHAYTAAGLYGFDPADAIPSHLRRVAKNVNFGIIYGAAEDRITATCGDPEAYDKYRTQFPGAAAFMDTTKASVEASGCVHTLFGYRLFVRPDPSHKGVNYIVQGTAGDLVKEAMKDLTDSPNSPLDWDRCRLVLNVHDELVFELDDDPDYLDATLPSLQRIMAAQGEKIGAVTPVDCKVRRTSWAE